MGVLALVVITPVLAAADIWLFKLMIDQVLVPRRWAAFVPIGLAFVGITLAAGAAGYAGQYLAAATSERFVLKLRNRIFAHLHGLSSAFLDHRRLGDVLSRLTGDVSAIESLMLSGLVSAVSILVQLGVFCTVLVYLNWRLALLSLAGVPLFWVCSKLFTPWIRRASVQSRRRFGALTSVAEESLANATLVQAYGREDIEAARFDAQGRALVAATLSGVRASGLFTPLVDLFEVLGVLVILGVGLWQLDTAGISLGGLLAFLIYLSQVYEPAKGLGGLANGFYAAAAGAERILELLDTPAGVPVAAEPVALPHPTGHLKLERVGLRYPHAGRATLTQVSLQLRPGTVTALIGPSGAGKTTLLKLLLRLLDPTTGTITLDGHDLRTLQPAQLRAAIAVVLQETLMFDASIADNIGAGRPEATREQIIAAAKVADVHEFIIGLPDGYQTRIGQRGRLLSGGQRQRIAIARAIIRDAPILILDEPTTGLDPATVQRIWAPLRARMSARTTLIISHDRRLTSLADQVLYLDAGHVTTSIIRTPHAAGATEGDRSSGNVTDPRTNDVGSLGARAHGPDIQPRHDSTSRPVTSGWAPNPSHPTPTARTVLSHRPHQELHAATQVSTKVTAGKSDTTALPACGYPELPDDH
jgi:ATP-binding cassette subfamily B protein